MKRPPGALRIVGGDWRRRHIPLAAHPGLRPTPDRVRETLFNWLAPTITGSRCLDAFAGSGALGIEALSRGAGEAVFIERDRGLAHHIDKLLRGLDAHGARVLTGDSPASWARLAGRFDLVFLDPPFDSDLLPPALAALPPLLAPGHRVYLEYPATTPPAMPPGWTILRDKRAGDVGYRLATWQAPGQDRSS